MLLYNIDVIGYYTFTLEPSGGGDGGTCYPPPSG